MWEKSTFIFCWQNTHVLFIYQNVYIQSACVTTSELCVNKNEFLLISFSFLFPFDSSANENSVLLPLSSAALCLVLFMLLSI